MNNDLNNNNLNNNNLGNNEDTMLNRERANIVQATIQANNAIDQKQAIEVNNAIKTEKHHNYMFIVVVLTVVVVCGIAGFTVYKLMSSAINFGDNKQKTTITTTSQMDRFNLYLRDYSRVRKFVSENYILLLSSDGCDLKNNKEHYLLIKAGEDGIIETKNGTYTIENNMVKLDKESFEYNENGIKYNDELLKIYDSEMKYYQYNDDNISYTLILNATSKNELSMFITSDKNNIDVKAESFMETESSITLGDNMVFTKVEGDLTYNNYTLKKMG